MALKNHYVYGGTAVLSIFSAGLVVLLRPGDIHPIVVYGAVLPLLLFTTAMLARWSRMIPSRQRALGWIALLLILLNAPATIYFHVEGYALQYDRFLHFAVSFFLIPLIMLLSGFLWEKALQVRTALALAVPGLVLWEGFQYLNDRLFGSNTFFDYGQNIRVDVAEDLVFGLAGIFLWLLLRKRIGLLDPS